MSDDPALKEFPAKKLFETKDMETRIDDIQFSPDSKYLAAGSHDRVIDIYAVYLDNNDSNDRFVKNGRCIGHSSTIIALDWSIDSTLVRSLVDIVSLYIHAGLLIGLDLDLVHS